MPYKEPEKRRDASRRSYRKNLEINRKRNRKYALAYYYKNKTKILTNLMAKYHSRTPMEVESQKQKRRKWLSAQSEQQRIYRKCYLTNNPHIRQAYLQRNRAKLVAEAARRRSLKQSAEGRFCAHDIKALYIRQFGLCFYCAIPLGDKYDVDHKIPLIKGGSTWPSNLALTCDFCNSSKGAKTEGWYQHWAHYQG